MKFIFESYFWDLFYLIEGNRSFSTNFIIPQACG